MGEVVSITLKRFNHFRFLLREQLANLGFEFSLSVLVVAFSLRIDYSILLSFFSRSKGRARKRSILYLPGVCLMSVSAVLI